MFDFKGFLGAVKRYWLLFLLTLIIAVVFFGGIIVKVYNTVRAKVPALPAAKVS